MRNIRQYGVLTGACFISLLGPVLTTAYASAVTSLVMACDHNYPPYEYVDDQGRPTGFNVDIARAVADHLGIGITIRGDAWAKVRDDLEQRRVDALCGMFYLPERDRLVDFTRPHCFAVQAVFKRKNAPVQSIGDLYGKTIIVQENDVMHDFARRVFPEHQLLTVPDQIDALRLLNGGHGEAALVNRAQGLHLAQAKNFDNIEILEPPLLQTPYCMAVPEGATNLQALLNRGLDSLRKDGTYQALHDKWFPPAPAPCAPYPRALYFLGILLLGACLYIGIQHFHLRRPTRPGATPPSVGTAPFPSAGTPGSTTADPPYGMLAEKGFDGICVIRGGMIMRPQHQFADLLGVPADTLTGTDLRKYMAPESQGKLEASCTRQQSGLTAITLLQKNGHPVHTQACCVPCRHEGQPAYIIGFRNIGEQLNAEARLRQNQELLEARVQQRAEELNTRMKEAETLNRAMINLLDDIQTTNRELQQTTTQLEAANQELEAFAYSVSHDLRAPLRAIDGFSQAIEEDYHDKLDDEGRQYLSRVRRASQRMGSLIDDMLQLSRLSRSHMHIETVDLSSMAADILRELQETQPQRQVQWQIQPDIRVSADRHLVRAALTNLLSNAWKFTSRLDLARITFGARREDGDTVCFVQDNGAGFDMTFADKLFGAFQRLHGQEEFSGSGIGLATVKRIIHRHGGQVWATGEPDKGATFYFRLPNSN